MNTALMTPAELKAAQSLTPQAADLLNHLHTHRSVTQREALLDLKIQSLTKRISELRAKGFVIVSDNREHKSTGQRYVRYFYKGVKPADAATVKEMPSEESAFA